MTWYPENIQRIRKRLENLPRRLAILANLICVFLPIWPLDISFLQEAYSSGGGTTYLLNCNIATMFYEILQSFIIILLQYFVLYGLFYIIIYVYEYFYMFICILLCIFIYIYTYSWKIFYWDVYNIHIYICIIRSGNYSVESWSTPYPKFSLVWKSTLKNPKN